jgi:hypothetical protein
MVILLSGLLQIQVHGAHDEASYTDNQASSLMSIDGSAFGRKSDVFPVTAPLRPIRPNQQDRQNRHQFSSSDTGSHPDSIRGNQKSSLGQVSVTLLLMKSGS